MPVLLLPIEELAILAYKLLAFARAAQIDCYTICEGNGKWKDRPGFVRLCRPRW
jgi:hypothetical protein